MFLNPIIITFFTLQIVTASQCCEQLNQLACIKCSSNMHLYRNNCIYNLPHCIQYLNGFDCIRCDINYQLIESQCRHVRLDIDPQRVSNFTPYLQSAIKPNLLFNQALEILTNNTDVWSDWLEEVLQNRNENSGGKQDISKEATAIQRRMMKGKKSLLNYIYTAEYHLNGLVLNLFRLTYQIGSPPGFADILVAIQANQGKVEYLQIVEVRINELKLQGWQELSMNDQVKVEKQLLELFSTIDDQLLVKGWCRATEKVYNFTIFEIDDFLGVIAYSWAAREQDLKRIGLNLTTSNTQNSTENSSPEQNAINSTKQQNKKNDTAKDKDSQQQSNEQKNTQSDSKTKNGTDSSIMINNLTNTTVPKDNKANTNSPQQQIILEISSMQSEDSLMSGYATAIKFGYVSRSALIEGASVFPFNSTYCLYFLDNYTYYQLMFHLNTKKSAFQIISFLSSKKSLIAANKSTNPSNSAGVVNKMQNATANSINKNIVIKTNKTSINSTYETTKKSQNINSTNTIVPKKDTTTEIKSNTSANTSNQNTTECSQSQSRSAFIDITKQISQDAYMPKINLLLTKMYADTLQDSRIGEVSYSWSVDVKTRVSSLTYNIIYMTILNQYYPFEVQIVNNQIKFTKIPANIKQSGTFPPISKNKTTAVPNNTVNKQSENTSKKSNETQNEIANTTENKDIETSTVSSNSKINTSFEDSLLVNITQAQAKPTEPPSSTQNNLNSEQKKTQQNTETIKKAENETTAANNNLSSQIVRNEVSATDYSQNPKYKPIVDIVCMIKRVPVNASFSKMQEWAVKEQNYYSILMIMNYSTPLNNGSSQKLFYFEVKVNASSYVTIIKYNISYCCTQNNTLVSNNPEPVSSTNKLVLLKTIGGIVQLSPYSNTLISTLRQNSAGLSKMSVQMISHNKSEIYTGFGQCFQEKLRFKDRRKVLCYEVSYCVPGQSKLDINGLLIRNYNLIGCSDKKEDFFLYSLLNAQFKQTSAQNKDLDDILGKIYNKSQIKFNRYQQFSNFYYVNFEDSQYSNPSFLYDISHQIFLSYTQNTVVQTASRKVFDQKYTQLISVQVKKILGLKKGTFQIILIQKDKLSDKVSLLSIFVVEKIDFWGARLDNLFYVQAKYDQTNSFISILNHKQIVRDQPILAQINTKILPKMYQVPLRTVFSNKKLTEIINKTNLNYKSFMEVSRLQAVLMPSQVQMQHFLNNSLTNETTIKIIVAKKYSDHNFGSYIITVAYNPSTKLTNYKGIQLVSSEVVKMTNCLDNKHQLGLPSCAVCNQGYRLIEGKCVAEISGCSEYHNFYCVGCSCGHISESLSSCQIADSEQSLLKIVNTYLLEVGNSS